MVSERTKTFGAFLVLGVGLWLASMQFTDDDAVQLAILLGVGVVVPSLLTELRDDGD